MCNLIHHFSRTKSLKTDSTIYKIKSTQVEYEKKQKIREDLASKLNGFTC